MSYNVLITSQFEKELKKLSKKYPTIRNDFLDLINVLSENPNYGTSIGNHCYKIRLAIKDKGKGKRGGARVISYFFTQNNMVYLLTIYDKSQKSDVKPGELREMISNLGLE